jgi:hypothetical protein
VWLGLVWLGACGGDDDGGAQLADEYEDALRALDAAFCECGGGTDCSATGAEELACTRGLIAEHEGRFHDDLACGIDNVRGLAACLRTSGCDVIDVSTCGGQLPDCRDLPDEVQQEFDACSPEFECENGETIEQSWVCDGEADCPSGEDENDC